MRHIKITKGHDLKISGIPGKNIIQPAQYSIVAVLPNDFRGVKPKLLVKEGDNVKIGSPLYFNKINPEIKWASPGCGIIKDIVHGPRRVIEKIEIELDKDQNSIKHKTYTKEEISKLSGEQVLDNILEANLFTFFRQRPFNIIPNHKVPPRDIFISGLNTSPLSVDIEVVLASQLEDFQYGVDAISKLTKGNVFLTTKRNSILSSIKNVILNTISGPHPAGNVGIQIHHIAHLKPGEIVWTINPQDVASLGRLFRNGRYDPKRIISVGGPKVKTPSYLKVIAGVPVKALINDNLTSENVRIISGDVLTGRSTSSQDYLSFYDYSLSVISNDIKREFIGMLNPGSSSSRYSLTPVFVSLTDKLFNFTSSQNGSHRAVVPINTWENVLPMDILPNELYRSILAKDIEEMENLGIVECDDEDFALCSFSCPSKTDVSGVIRQGLNLLQAEV